MLNRREILKTALVNPWWAGEPSPRPPADCLR